MHKHSKDNCISFKDKVNDMGLSFAGKVGLGPFWTWVQVLSYEHVLQLFDSTSPSGTSVYLPSKIYMRMQMQYLIDDF
jgi:hypothetical protein